MFDVSKLAPEMGEIVSSSDVPGTMTATITPPLAAAPIQMGI